MPVSRRNFIALSASAAVASTLPLGFAVGAQGGLRFSDYRQFDALGLAEAIRLGQFTAAEVLAAAIDRANAVNPIINAIVTPHYDYARQQLAGATGGGPFAGVPFLLKDLAMQLQGTVTSEGSRFYAGRVAKQTDTLVQRYLDAGLLMMGKSASPEFGGTTTTESILYGATRNPWDLEKTTGGSSGGAAAAVAADILPMANATDGGGSIRIPASCCGLFGLKPSRGRTPHGPNALTSLMSVNHCVSRSVRDSAALLDATAGMEPGAAGGPNPPVGSFLQASRTPPKSLRIGLLLSPISRSPVHSDCLTAANRAALLCESLGHRIEPLELPIAAGEFFHATGIIMAAGNVARVQLREKELGREVTEHDLEPLIYQRYRQALSHSAADYHAAVNTVHRIGRQMSLLHNQYDLILSPTLANPPLEIGRLALTRLDPGYLTDVLSYSAFTMLANATGAPAMSVPLEWSDAGLPVGVMFAADYGREALLLQLAGQLEQAQPWFAKRAKL